MSEPAGGRRTILGGVGGGGGAEVLAARDLLSCYASAMQGPVLTCYRAVQCLVLTQLLATQALCTARY
eukprot:2385024-Rhodomonas_salina.1